jgi:hypothetical protein
MNKHLQLATLVLTAGLAAAAQTSDTRMYRVSGNEWIQEVHGTLSAAKTLKVISTAGAIRIQGGQQNNITYIAREHVRAGSEEAARRALSGLKFSVGSGEFAWLKAECDGSNRRFTDFEIQAPAQTAMLKLETEGGAVAVNNISGKVIANTGGGEIKLDQVGGAITASSGGGNIEIGKVGSDVKAETGGGSIHIDSAGGTIAAKSGGGNLRIGNGKVMWLETGGGRIQVAKCEGKIKAESGGGGIELSDVLGPAEIQTGGGGIKVGPIIGGIRAETGSGPIYATLARGGIAFTDSRLETSVGDIVVYVPDGLAITIRAAVEAARGQGIQSDFSEIKVHGSGQYGPREFYAEGSLNGGGPVLHVHTSTGNIAIKRKGKE